MVSNSGQLGRITLIGCVLAALLVGNSANATPTDELLRRAEVHYSNARFGAAVRLLQRSAKQSGEPQLLSRIYLLLGANLAVLERRDDARRAFRLALTHQPAATLDNGRFKRSILDLLAEVRRSTRGTLTVVSEASGVDVWVDGRRRGVAPVSLSLPVGAHRVVARKSEKELKIQEVIVSLGQAVEVVVRGDLDEPAAGAGRLWTWVAGGAAVVLLGAGVGLRVAAGSDHDECAELGQNAANLERWQEARDAGQAKETAATVMFGLGAAAAVGAVVLFFVEGKRSSAERRASWSLTPSVGPAGLALGGTF